MILKTLREEVLEANLELVRRGLVLYTFGNASGIARDEGMVVIKPSGIPYDKMKPEDLVVTDLQGKIVEGLLRPSSDASRTHCGDFWYREFASIGGIRRTRTRGRQLPGHRRSARFACHSARHGTLTIFMAPIPVTESHCHRRRFGQTMKQTQAAPSCGASRSLTRCIFPPCWWPAMHRFAGEPLPPKPRTLR